MRRAQGSYASLGLSLVLLAGCGGAPRGESSEERERREAALMREELRASWTPPVLLWQVSVAASDGAPSFVLASMPYGTTLSSALPAPHDELLGRVTSLVVDVDPSALELPALYDTYRLPRRERLDRLLGASAWTALVGEVGALLPESALRTIEPWVLTLHVERVRMAEAEADADERRRVPGAVSTSSMTSELVEEARRRGTTIGWIDDDPATYIGDLTSVARAHWVLALRELLEDTDAARTRAEHLRAAYASRDEGQLRAACEEVGANDPDAGEVRRELLAHRAERWLPAVEGHLRHGGTLVALDACTLVADGGLLSLLYGTGLGVQRLGAAPGTERP